ncbi:MAG: hypothetical protein HQL07_03050 [Nitrospirae bacterium]|nr:hypothetical protein [Magnetococcales bacterium]HAT50437.1 hypothetical protein [Alphaproteobacteria bacterium]
MGNKNKPSRATPDWGFDFYAIDTGMKDYTDENRAKMRDIFQRNDIRKDMSQRILGDDDIEKLISFTSDVLFEYMMFKSAEKAGPRQKDNLEMVVRIEKESHKLKEHLRLMGTDLKWQFDFFLRKVDSDFVECLQLDLDRMIKLCEKIRPLFSSEHLSQGGRPTDDLPGYINRIRDFYKNLNPFLDGIPPGKKDLPLQNYLKLSLECAGIEFSGHPGTLITRSDEWADKIKKKTL